MTNDSLGDRMKGYENISRVYLTRRMPAIIRVDGKAFHSFTRGFKRPFDEILHQTMWETGTALCKNIEGCQLAYIQSDEISLLLTDYENIKTEAWFGKNIQKMVSISASIATLAFNKEFPRLSSGEEPYAKKYNQATFDSRVFILPKEEVNNYFIWRQQDATRNSVLSVGQANFSHKELQNTSCNQIQDKLFLEKQINFNDFETWQKRGVCIVKNDREFEETIRRRWEVDMDIPIFTENRDYVEGLL
jgi:tRNA(His) 5'-end guanylyltransferase